MKIVQHATVEVAKMMRVRRDISSTSVLNASPKYIFAQGVERYLEDVEDDNTKLFTDNKSYFLIIFENDVEMCDVDMLQEAITRTPTLFQNIDISDASNAIEIAAGFEMHPTDRKVVEFAYKHDFYDELSEYIAGNY